MDVAADRKLFLGARLKRLRRDLGLTQTAMAADLAVSPSYLNHIERNQRPVSAQLLLRLADTYDVDLRQLNQGGEADAAKLGEVFSDPVFKGLTAPRHELLHLLDEAPGVADALLRLYRAFDDQRTRARAAVGAGEALTDDSPAEWVREYVQSRGNHFPGWTRWEKPWPRPWRPTPPPTATASSRPRGDGWRPSTIWRSAPCRPK